MAGNPLLRAAPALLGCIISAALCWAEEADVVPALARPAPDDAVPSASDADLTGQEIYARVLANRHRAYFQKLKFVSSDEGGEDYETQLWSRWKDSRDDDGVPQSGVQSKTLSKYTSPLNVRGVGYLVLQKVEPPNDQFVYFPSARKVRRVNLGEAIMGTDFSLEDIVPREIEDSTNVRRPDAVSGEVECFVLEVVPNADSGSQYSKLEVHVEKDHYVPIRTRYWNHDGLEVKEHTTPPALIEEVEGVWLTHEATMRDLIENSQTTLHILEMEPNAKIRESTFSERNLISKSR